MSLSVSDAADGLIIIAAWANALPPVSKFVQDIIVLVVVLVSQLEAAKWFVLPLPPISCGRTSSVWLAPSAGCVSPIDATISKTISPDTVVAVIVGWLVSLDTPVLGVGIVPIGVVWSTPEKNA